MFNVYKWAFLFEIMHKAQSHILAHYIILNMPSHLKPK